MHEQKYQVNGGIVLSTFTKELMLQKVIHYVYRVLNSVMELKSSNQAMWVSCNELNIFIFLFKGLRVNLGLQNLDQDPNIEKLDLIQGP